MPTLYAHPSIEKLWEYELEVFKAERTAPEGEALSHDVDLAQARFYLAALEVKFACLDFMIKWFKAGRPSTKKRVKNSAPRH